MASPLYCCIKNCKSKKCGESCDPANTKFHRFPRFTPSARIEWQRLLIEKQLLKNNKANIDNLLVCSQHFNKSDYTKSGIRLNRGVKPSIFTCPENLDLESCTPEFGTTEIINKKRHIDQAFQNYMDDVKSEPQKKIGKLETIEDLRQQLDHCREKLKQQAITIKILRLKNMRMQLRADNNNVLLKELQKKCLLSEQVHLHLT